MSGEAKERLTERLRAEEHGRGDVYGQQQGSINPQGSAPNSTSDGCSDCACWVGVVVVALVATAGGAGVYEYMYQVRAIFCPRPLPPNASPQQPVH